MIDKKLFANPSGEPSLDDAQVPFWFLNGDLERAELVRQLDLMRGAGVKNAILHARSGFVGGYLDEKWFGDIRAIVEDKRNHGEHVWLYDEFNWPSGTCNQTVTRDENMREQYLIFDRIPLVAGERYARVGWSTGCIAIQAFEAGRDEPVDLMGGTGFSIEYEARADAEVIEVRLVIDPARTFGRESINYLDDRAVRAFIESTHEQYYRHMPEAFGREIAGLFNDEPRFGNPYPWSDGFAEAFRARKGYDILPVLGCLVMDNAFAQHVRCDYFDTCAHLYQTAYFEQMYDWCEAHGIALSAHLLGEETLASQVRFCGDYMRQTRFLHYPGIDHLGKGIGGLNAKFGASAARNYGKPNFNCEVYAGCGWDMSFEAFTRIATWLMQQGVCTIINHGFFYSTEGERHDDWPPSQFFQWQHWNRMPEYNAMLRRLRLALSGGHWESDVLMYNPVESFWAHCQGDVRFKHGFFHLGPEIKDARAAFIDRELQLLMCALEDANTDFVMLNADAMDGFVVRDGAIANELNGERYRVLVLPMCEVLPLAVLKLAQRFARQGGKVIALDCLPEMASERGDDAELKQVLQEMRDAGQIELMSVQEHEALVRLIDEIYPPPLTIVQGVNRCRHTAPYQGSVVADPYLHGDAHTGGHIIPATVPGGEDLTGVAFKRYVNGDQRIFFFANYDTAPQWVTVRVQSIGVPEVLDSMTGAAAPADVVSQQDGFMTIRLELPPNHATLLVT